MYAILIDDLNHTCFYLVDSPSQSAAEELIFSQDWRTQSSSFSSDSMRDASVSLRLEIQEVSQIQEGMVRIVFCSKDQIHELPDNPSTFIGLKHLQLALTCQSAQMVTESIPLYQSALKLLPGDLFIYVHLAKAYQSLGMLEAAIATYQECMSKIDSDSVIVDEVLSGLGGLYKTMNDVDNAVLYYSKYIELQDRDSVQDTELDSEELMMGAYLKENIKRSFSS